MARKSKTAVVGALVSRHSQKPIQTMRGLVLGAFVVAGAALALPHDARGQEGAPAAAVEPATSQKALLDQTNQATQALIAGNLDHALGLFDAIISTNAPAPKIMAAAHYHRGIIHQKRGAFNKAAADYTTALWLEQLPDNMRARAHYNRGTALDNLGQQARARQDFDTAISLAPDMSAAYNNRANVLRRMGEPEAAIADYDKSIELENPLPHLPHYGRAIAREEIGDIEGARADLTRALSLAPSYAPAQAALAALPDEPSALSVAAAPEPVQAPGAAAGAAPSTAATTAMADLSSLGGIDVEPVEVAVLPPAPRLPTKPAPADASIFSRGPAVPNPAQSQAVAAATYPSYPVPPRITTSATGQPQRPANAAEPVRVAQNTTQTSSPAPMPMMGTWTTTILPAGSKEVVTLDDAQPAIALRSTRETQVAAISPSSSAGVSAQPKAGLTFPGVPAESYREAARIPAPARSSMPAPSSGSGYAVQLGSFRSEAEAEQAWAGVSRHHGNVLLDRDHIVQRAEVPGRGTYFRLRVGPLTAHSSASALCSTLKSQGQDCYVTKL